MSFLNIFTDSVGNSTKGYALKFNIFCYLIFKFKDPSPLLLHSSSPSTLTEDFIYGQLGITLFVQTVVISVQIIQKPIIYNFRGKILFCLLSKETCPSNNNNNHVLSAVKRGEGHFIDTYPFKDCFDPDFGISLWNDPVYCRKSSCQFHQHLTRRFLIHKCFAKLFYTFCLSLYFLAK